jgi:hypothetical protein
VTGTAPAGSHSNPTCKQQPTLVPTDASCKETSSRCAGPHVPAWQPGCSARWCVRGPAQTVSWLDAHKAACSAALPTCSEALL